MPHPITLHGSVQHQLNRSMYLSAILDEIMIPRPTGKNRASQHPTHQNITDHHFAIVKFNRYTSLRMAGGVQDVGIHSEGGKISEGIQEVVGGERHIRLVY